MPRQITDAEIGDFREKGAVLLRGILPNEWVDLVRAGLEELRLDPGPMTTRATGKGGRGELMIDQFASLRNEKLRRFRDESPAAEIAGHLLGEQDARFYIDQIFYKGSGRVLPTNWHQDTPYLRIAGNDICRLWTTCDPSPRQATVKVIRGSHLWNVVYAPNPDTEALETIETGDGFSYGSNADYDSSLVPVPDIDAHPGAFDILEWDVQPGDVLAFNGNILHGAGGIEDHPHKRRALATVWVGDDVRYRVRPGISLPDLVELKGKEMRDGTLLSDRPDIFPAGWTAIRRAPG